MGENELPRLTYEEVLARQIDLGKEITRLIKENRSLDEDTRWDFYSLYQRATLGLGASESLNSPRIPGSSGWSVDFIVFNYLMSGSTSIITGYETKTHQKETPVSVLWEAVLNRLLGVVFGAALVMAARMSPEKDEGLRYGGLREKK